MTFGRCRASSLPASVLYNLDEDESQGGIAVNLLPLLARELQHRAESWTQGDKRVQKSVPILMMMIME